MSSPRWIALLLPLLLAACGLARPGATEARELRVLVYNIHAGTDAEGRHNLERVASLIEETGADLALLQEVDRGTSRSGGEDQPAELQRLSGREAAFGRTLDYQGGEYGIAVLSRWPIVADTLYPLIVEPPQERAGGAYEPRGVLQVAVEAPHGRIRVLNTHLDASAGDLYRRQEVERLLEIAGPPGPGALTLIGGDLNALPHSAVIDRLRASGWRDAWELCGAGSGETFPADEPIRRIDYLFLPAGAGCERAEVIESAASDHRPLFVIVSVAR